MVLSKTSPFLNQPKPVRAIAQANGRNPLAIMIPCHRVIACKGTLAGYHYGIEKKKELLHHEKHFII